jgi:hypothetical protein
MHKNKLILPISILLGCIVLGSFYYFSQLNKQKSIETQQRIELQAKADQAALVEEIAKQNEIKYKEVVNNPAISNPVIEIPTESWGVLEDKLLPEALSNGRDTAIIKNSLGEIRYYSYFYRTGWDQAKTEKEMNELAKASRAMTEYEKSQERIKKSFEATDRAFLEYQLRTGSDTNNKTIITECHDNIGGSITCFSK